MASKANIISLIDDEPTHEYASSFFEGDGKRSGGKASDAFAEPIEDRNFCVGPLYLGEHGEYVGGALTQVGDTLVRGEWVQVRLSAAEAKQGVGLAFRPGQGASRFAVLGSNDGSIFKELLQADADVWPLGRTVNFPFANKAAYRYYRVVLLKGQPGCNGYLCIHKIAL